MPARSKTEESEFWQLSRSDLFALLDQSGKLVAVYDRGTPLNRTASSRPWSSLSKMPDDPLLLMLDGHLYEVATQPLWFGSRESGTLLGSVAVGYAIDDQVAREVSEAAAAEVVFIADGRICCEYSSARDAKQLTDKAAEFSAIPCGQSKDQAWQRRLSGYIIESDKFATQCGCGCRAKACGVEVV